jgi:peptide/nickel transport system substrate-binding protein
LTACGTGADSAAGGKGNGQPVSGGSATYINHTESLSLDPMNARLEPGQGGNVMPPLYDQLIWVEQDGTVVPRLATVVTTSDGKVWQITLREGAKFSDGTPFDADAVKFNWERLQKPGVPNGAAAQTIDTIEVIDPRTLRVTLKAPNRQWHRYLMTGLGFIGSPTAIGRLGNQFGTQPVGAGPFVLTELVQGDHLTLRRNPPTGTPRGRTSTSSSSARFRSLSSGTTASRPARATSCRRDDPFRRLPICSRRATPSRCRSWSAASG